MQTGETDITRYDRQILRGGVVEDFPVGTSCETRVVDVTRRIAREDEVVSQGTR